MKFQAFLSLILLAIFATTLASQVNVTTGARTAQSGAELANWHFDVDFGSTPQNVSLTATLEASTNAGIEIEVWMIDMITGSATTAQATNHRMVLGFPVGGTASSVIWGTGAPDGFPAGPFSMSGVHRFQFTVSADNAAGAFPVDLTASFETNTGTLVPPVGTVPPGSSGVTHHLWSQSAATTPGLTPGFSLVGSSDCYQRNHGNTALCRVRFADGNDEPAFFIDVDQGAAVDVSMRVLAFGSGGSADVTAELYNLTQGWDTPIISADASTSNPGTVNAGFGTNLGVRTPALTRYRVVVAAQNVTASPGNFADFLIEICFGNAATLLDVAREPEQASPRMEITPASMQLSTSTALTVTGGTSPPAYNWALETPVPQGVSLSGNTGASVTLQVDASALPDFTVTVRCQNGQTGEVVRQVYGPVQVLRPAELPSGIEGVPWPGRTFEGAGGETPYSWSATGLPPGLSIDAGTGRLSGTPTAAGDFASVEIFVTDNASVTASRVLAISIGAAPPLAIAPATLPGGMAGLDYGVLIGAAGGVAPFTWSLSAGGLPPGVSLGASTTGTVEISGIPAASGSFSFTVRLEDANANAVTRDYTVDIASRPTSGGTSSGGSCTGGEGAAPWGALLLLAAALGAARCAPTGSRRLRSMRG